MGRADQLIAYGVQEIGSPYVWGDEGPNTFDCSGLMLYLFEKVGIKLPRTAREQQDYAQLVNKAAARPGDLVFYGDPATHVGLYLGGGRMLAAPKAGDKVKVQDVYGSPQYRRVPELGGVSGNVGAVISPISNPVQDWAGDLLGGVESSLRIGLVAVLGVALVAVGAYQATKGDSR